MSLKRLIDPVTFQHNPTEWEPFPLDVVKVPKEFPLYTDIPQAIRDMVPGAVEDDPDGIKLLRVKSVLTEYISNNGSRVETVFKHVPLVLIEGMTEGFNWETSTPKISEAGLAVMAAAFGVSISTS